VHLAATALCHGWTWTIVRTAMPRRPSRHVDDPRQVGARLRAARRAAGLSQRQLAFAGCTPAYISRIEAGTRTPSYQILRELGRQLGVSADYLATGHQDSRDEPDPLFEAEVALRLGDGNLARELYQRVRDAAESELSVARAEAGLGQLALSDGQTRQAIELLEGALASGRLGVSEASDAGNALGRAYASQGRYEEAFDLFGRFLSAARERGDQFEIIRFSVLLANAYLDSGNFGRAQELLGEIVEPARRSLDPMLQASLSWSQSRLHSSQGNPDLAAHYAHLTIATLRASEHTLAAANALLLLAHIENDRGNPTAALELAAEGAPVLAAAGQTIEEGLFLVERARALAALGESEQAASLLLGIVPRFSEARPTTAARAYSAAADFFRSHGDPHKALELYELAAERFSAPDRHLAATLTAMAELHEQQGNTDEALRLLKAALQARADVNVDAR
jgi:tetratricopeptide (TPR) repeat protein